MSPSFSCIFNSWIIKLSFNGNLEVWKRIRSLKSCLYCKRGIPGYRLHPKLMIRKLGSVINVSSAIVDVNANVNVIQCILILSDVKTKSWKMFGNTDWSIDLVNGNVQWIWKVDICICIYGACIPYISSVLNAKIKDCNCYMPRSTWWNKSYYYHYYLMHCLIWFTSWPLTSMSTSGHSLFWRAKYPRLTWQHFLSFLVASLKRIIDFLKCQSDKAN